MIITCKDDHGNHDQCSSGHNNSNNTSTQKKYLLLHEYAAYKIWAANMFVKNSPENYCGHEGPERTLWAP